MKRLLSQYCNLKFDKIGYKEGISLTPLPTPLHAASGGNSHIQLTGMLIEIFKRNP